MTNAGVLSYSQWDSCTHDTFEAYFRCSLLSSQNVLAGDYQLSHSFCQAFKNFKPPAWSQHENTHAFAQHEVRPTAECHHTETRRERHPIPARTLSQQLILKSQHTMFTHLHCFQLNTDNWHSHWACYQPAWSHLKATALGKEGSKRKHKISRDWTWQVYAPQIGRSI